MGRLDLTADESVSEHGSNCVGDPVSALTCINPVVQGTEVRVDDTARQGERTRRLDRSPASRAAPPGLWAATGDS